METKKYHLITTKDYELCVDEEAEPKNGEWVYTFDSVFGNEREEHKVFKYDDRIIYSLHFSHTPKLLPIIFHKPLNNSPVLDGVPLLPSEEDEVEKLALDKATKFKNKCLKELEQGNAPEKATEENISYTALGLRLGIKDGYKVHAETHKFTEEQMREAMQYGIGYGTGNPLNTPEQRLNIILNYLQSLIQKYFVPELNEDGSFKVVDGVVKGVYE